MATNHIQRFRLINTLEGYSYLALLFIAMPLKYVLGFALAVKIVGMAHGVLFIGLIILMIPAYQQAKWAFNNNIIYFVAALIPFGTFYTSKQIKGYEQV